jgi:hypothetical protein
VAFKGQGRADIFDQLSADEIASVAHFLKQAGLIDYKFGGRMTAEMDANPDTFTQQYNFVPTYQLLNPNKAAASAYLAEETNEPPPRFAKVTVYRGRPEERDVMQYTVGPLPISDATAAKEMWAAGTWPWGLRAEHYTSESHQYSPRVEAAFDVVSSMIDGLGYKQDYGGGDDDGFWSASSELARALPSHIGAAALACIPWPS